jgi:hypothetical protein
MTSFKELAVVAGTGERGAELISRVNGHAITASNSTSDDTVQVSAWLVWEYMIGKARAGGVEIPGAEPAASGSPAVTWFEWHGSMTGVIVTLALTEGLDDDVNGNLRRAVNRWLRKHGNAVCLWTPGGRKKAGNPPPVWAVRSEFREVLAPDDLPVFSLRWRRSSVPPVVKPSAPAPAITHSDAGTGPGLVTAPPAGGGSAPQSQPRAESAEDALPGPHSKLGAGRRTGQLHCPRCRRPFKASHLSRHFFAEHADPLELMLGVLQQRDQLANQEAASILSEATGGGIVTTAFIAHLFAPAVKAGQVAITRGYRNTPVYHAARPALTAGAAGSPPAPVAEAAAPPPPLVPSPPFQPEAHPGPGIVISGTADAELPDDLNDLLRPLDALASQAASAAAAIRTRYAEVLRENASLKEYQLLVRRLLSDTSQPPS